MKSAWNFTRQRWFIAFLAALAVPLVGAALSIRPAGATRAQEAGESAPSSWTLTTIYTFGCSGCGITALSGVIRDNNSNLYGTTFAGGEANECMFNAGCGTVFQVDPTGMVTNLHVFTGPPDGANSEAPVVRDAAGNLYGTTEFGGDPHCEGYGCGTVFKLSPDGIETILQAFSNPRGAFPQSGVILDTAGNIYGTASGSPGVVFELDENGHSKILYHFSGGADGEEPVGGLVRDSEGKLYGTTVSGGLANSACEFGSCGVVYRVDSPGKETVLYSFAGGTDGANPRSTLIHDSRGNFYGTTSQGGNTGCTLGTCGVVFKLHPDGREEVLYSFTGHGKGGNPITGLVSDGNGNLFGSTEYGGNPGCSDGAFTCGVIFRVDKEGNETLLYSFTGGSDGSSATGVLSRDSIGNLYGTTGSTVFKLSPPQ